MLKKLFSFFTQRRERKIISHEIDLLESVIYKKDTSNAYFEQEKLNSQLRKVLGDVDYLKLLKNTYHQIADIVVYQNRATKGIKDTLMEGYNAIQATKPGADSWTGTAEIAGAKMKALITDRAEQVNDQLSFNPIH